MAAVPDALDAAPVEQGPRVAIMQPYFLPSLIYFHLLDACDVFVFYDDAQFVTKRFTHRNALLLGESEYRFTVPLAKRSQNRRIDEIELHEERFGHWRRKFLATLRMNFAAGAVIDELAELTRDPGIGLAGLSQASIRWAAARAGISPRFLKSSDLEYDRTASAQDKILAMCKGLGASGYVNSWGGRCLYESDDFARQRIDLQFCRSRGLPEGLASQSILKPMLTRDPAEICELAKRYELTEITDDE